MITAFFKPKRVTDDEEEIQVSVSKKLKVDVEVVDAEPDTEKPDQLELDMDFKGLELEHKFLPPDWQEALKPVIESTWFLKLKLKLQSEKEKGAIIYPPTRHMYSFASCPLAEIKVVILGQDPYHQPNQGKFILTQPTDSALASSVV
jgi:hypothetical protein